MKKTPVFINGIEVGFLEDSVNCRCVLKPITEDKRTQDEKNQDRLLLDAMLLVSGVTIVRTK